MEVVVTTGAISRAKFQLNHHHQQINTQFFTGWMPFLSPNQQCENTEDKNITFHEIAHPKLTLGLPTLSLTTNSSWLPWGRVAMPLISPLMPVPQDIKKIQRKKFHRLTLTLTQNGQSVKHNKGWPAGLGWYF